MLEKIQKYYEKQINAGRWGVEYEVGQKVLLNVKNFTMSKGLTLKFMSKFVGPILIVEQIFKDVYKLSEIKIVRYFMFQDRILVAQLQASD